MKSPCSVVLISLGVAFIIYVVVNIVMLDAEIENIDYQIQTIQRGSL